VAGFSLTPAGPFSLAATGEFLGAAAPLAGTSAADEALRLVFPLDDLSGSGGAVLRETDGAVEGVATGPAAAVREQVARILSLDVDARGFVAVGEDDPVVGRLQRRFAGLRPPLFSMPFEAGCWALLSQRTQMRQAAALRQRLVEELGEPVDLEGGPLCAFPLPQRILELDRVASPARSSCGCAGSPRPRSRATSTPTGCARSIPTRRSPSCAACAASGPSRPSSC